MMVRTDMGGTKCQVVDDCALQPLPPSSSDLNVPLESVADFLSVYSFLRCFSGMLFLSPFAIEEFAEAVEQGNVLMDCVHMSLLQALWRQLQHLCHPSSPFLLCYGSFIGVIGHRSWVYDKTFLFVYSSPVEPGFSNVRYQNNDLLGSFFHFDSVQASQLEFARLGDLASFLVAFLRNQGYSRLRGYSLVQAGLAKGEYQTVVQVSEKLAILSFLCDHVLQTDESRTELSLRIMSAHLPLYDPLQHKFVKQDCQWRQHEDNEGQEILMQRNASERLLRSRQSRHRSGGLHTSSTDDGDGNINECALCGMDGNLICCDACPAAFHSRCVGVAKASLPSGNWFCPECCHNTTGDSPSKQLQGAQLLGVGPHGRFFLATCGYLLVSEAFASRTPQHWYYGMADLTEVLNYLQGCGPAYDVLYHAIKQHWQGVPSSSSQICLSDGRTVSKGSSSSSPRGMHLSNGFKKMEAHKGNYPRVQQSSGQQLLQRVTRGSCDSIQGQENAPQATCPYVNHYALADAVASAAAILAAWQVCGDPGSVARCKQIRKTSADEQVRAFAQTVPSFTWPSFMKRSNEACGWCVLCLSKNPCGCLLLQAEEQMECPVEGLRLTFVQKGPHHLAKVAAYLLHLEATLHPLLVGGPWEVVGQRWGWRSCLEHDCSISAVKLALLQLEASLRGIAISSDWVKDADDGPVLCPANMLVRQLPPTRDESMAAVPCGVQWWRGGHLARQLCNWEALPQATAKLAGRQGGLRLIAGLLYNDTAAVPRRNKQCAWRAQVESSSSVAQLGLQVRYLDAHIKWSQLLADQGARERASIHAKCTVEGVVKYLVELSDEDIGAQKQPSVGCRSKSRVRKQVWKTEQQVPLPQVKHFEGKLRSMTKSKLSQVACKDTIHIPLKRKTLNTVLEELLEEKPQVVSDGRCQRCQDICQTPSLHVVDGVWVCELCQQPRHGKWQHKASLLAKQASEEPGKQGTSLYDNKDSPVSWKQGDNVMSDWSVAEMNAQVLQGKHVKRKRVSEGAWQEQKKEVRPRKAKRKHAWGDRGRSRYSKNVVHVGLQGSSRPICCLCHAAYDPALFYVSCRFCGNWFHGDAVKVMETMAGLKGFKCYKCRKRRRPLCPKALPGPADTCLPWAKVDMSTLQHPSALPMMGVRLGELPLSHALFLRCHHEFRIKRCSSLAFRRAAQSVMNSW